MNGKGEPMNILIKGMEKPISCDDCIVPLSKCDFLQRRADECPIVEIPTPHGRLIDADALETVFKDMAKCEWNQKVSPISWAYAFEDTIDEIQEAPTILEAEG